MADQHAEYVALDSLAGSGYQTIVADPPWPQKGRGRSLRQFGGENRGFPSGYTDSSLPLQYKTMTVAEIGALPVADIIAPQAHLYLWTTNRFLPDAFDVIKAWGFNYSTTLVWAKAPIGGGLGGCYGIATEYVLFARRGTLPALGKVGRNWFDWKRARDTRGKPLHSGKPTPFFDMVETISPGPYLEMFARRARLGWDGWGDEYEVAA